jgi:poly-gamma-glutamate capsule biosynthesis protein CapA/YwtB (metallophosphatase superfamily)
MSDRTSPANDWAADAAQHTQDEMAQQRIDSAQQAADAAEAARQAAAQQGGGAR